MSRFLSKFIFKYIVPFLSFLFKKYFEMEMSLINTIVSEEDVIYEEDFNEVY